jgi:hypothetical protein
VCRAHLERAGDGSWHTRRTWVAYSDGDSIGEAGGVPLALPTLTPAEEGQQPTHAYRESGSYATGACRACAEGDLTCLACGEARRVVLHGVPAERDRKVARLLRLPCPQCHPERVSPLEPALLAS